MFLIGALTAKSYAFSVRPWELERFMSIDFFDSFGSEIYIEFFGLDLKRILPKMTKIIYENDWITNRIRFFYDSLLVQRLSNCYILINNKYKIFSWFGVYLYFKYINIFKYKVITLKSNIFNISFYYYLSNTVDLYDLMFLKHWSLIFDYSIFNNFTLFDNNYLNIDYLNNYFYYDNFTLDLSFYQNIFLLGYNIRCEHPLLFVKLYDLIRKKKIVVFVFGFTFFFFVKAITFIGIMLKDFFTFFFKFKFKKNLLLIGSGILNRYDFVFFDFFFSKLKVICDGYKILFKYFYITFSLIDLNLIFLGIKNDFRQQVIKTFKYKSFNYFDNFNFFFFENDVFYNNLYLNFFGVKFLSIFILLSSHFYVENQLYHLILPVVFFFEKDNFMLNIFSLFYKLKFIFTPHYKMKQSNLIINYFLNSVNNSLKNYKTLFLYKNFYKYQIFTRKFLKINYMFNFIYYLKKSYFFSFYVFNELKFVNFLFFNFNSYCYNIFYLNSINNFYLVNMSSKLSKNLIFGFLTTKYLYNYSIK